MPAKTPKHFRRQLFWKPRRPSRMRNNHRCLWLTVLVLSPRCCLGLVSSPSLSPSNDSVPVAHQAVDTLSQLPPLSCPAARVVVSSLQLSSVSPRPWKSDLKFVDPRKAFVHNGGERTGSLAVPSNLRPRPAFPAPVLGLRSRLAPPLLYPHCAALITHPRSLASISQIFSFSLQ